jgi:hypothetical protein
MTTSRERSVQRVLEELARAYGSHLRAAFIVSGMSEKRFAADVLAGRGERTLRRWLTKSGTVPREVERWAARIVFLEVDDAGLLRLHLMATPKPRLGRPRKGELLLLVTVALSPVAQGLEHPLEREHRVLHRELQHCAALEAADRQPHNPSLIAAPNFMHRQAVPLV